MIRKKKTNNFSIKILINMDYMNGAFIQKWLHACQSNMDRISEINSGNELRMNCKVNDKY